jgi:endonuclease/exonuclease/phosphatase family metal-dependent hydrolase
MVEWLRYCWSMTLEPFGPLIESTMRVVTWNVWGTFGPWRERQEAIGAELRSLSPDVVTFQEAFSLPEYEQTREIAFVLGFPYYEFAGERGEDGVFSGTSVMSRWPISATDVRQLGDVRRGNVMKADIDGPRGTVRLFSAILDWPPHYSQVRQEQVKEIVSWVSSVDRAAITLVCGDFNAPPDSDEIRMLNGRTQRVCWHDAWEFAGDGPGYTWSNENPWAAAMLYRNQRIDYVFSTGIQAGGVGHPVGARLVGVEPVASDHFGVVADLRY